MNDILEDIDVIENVLIAFNEGASDEKFMAYRALTKLLIKKKDLVTEFEFEMEKEFASQQ